MHEYFRLLLTLISIIPHSISIFPQLKLKDYYMKIIGIIGGLGSESTMDYYKKIISVFNTQYKQFAYPEIVIFSANLNEVMAIVESRNWTELVNCLLKKVNALYDAGADFAAIASNTPHIIFDQLRSRSPIPIISIVEATCRKALQAGVKKPGLLGTKLTMESGYYSKAFLEKGISLVVPKEQEQNFIQQKLFSEIEFGIFNDSTRQDLLKIVKRMKQDDSIDSIILGCTELPLILSENNFDITVFNTTAIHCEEIVSYCLQ